MTECIRGLFYSRNNLLRGVALLVALACAGLLCADAARGQAQGRDPLSGLSAGGASDGFAIEFVECDCGG